MITIGNIRSSKEGVYIGRANRRWNLESSPLANPFAMKTEADRALVIQQYRQWLWQQIQNKNSPAFIELNRLAVLANKQDLCLKCWCSPKPCHGDVVKRAIEWINQSNKE